MRLEEVLETPDGNLKTSRTNLYSSAVYISLSLTHSFIIIVHKSDLIDVFWVGIFMRLWDLVGNVHVYANNCAQVVVLLVVYQKRARKQEWTLSHYSWNALA